MDSLYFILALTIISAVIYIFLIYRLSFFGKENVSGKSPFVIGGFLVLFGLVWQAIKASESYNSWFLEAAYPIIDWIQFLFFLAGAVLIGIGLALYTDYWQVRKEELSYQEQKLAIVNNLQRDARHPYQLMELLSLSIKEIVAQIPQTSGAIFLVNRSKRQLVLVETAGLNKNEIASLEKYPIGQNIITQSIEANEPFVSGFFEFHDQAGTKTESRFNSTLVLPLVSGSEKIGCMVLLSETKFHFTKSDCTYLMPLMEWLSEKIRTTKLTKEINLISERIEQLKLKDEFNIKRFKKISDSFNAVEPIDTFCKGLVGLLKSKSVHICGLKNGSLQFYGNSEPVMDLNENYKTALIDALDRNKPLIINQEAQNESGISFIVRSTFIYPIDNSSYISGVILISEHPFGEISDYDMKLLSIYANLARQAIELDSSNQMKVTRRKGFDRIISLLNFENKLSYSENPSFFIRHLSEIMPSNTIAVALKKESNGSFKAVKGYHTFSAELDDMLIYPGEGLIGQLNADLAPRFVYGNKNIRAALDSFSESNQNIFYKLFDEDGLPQLMAVCPINDNRELLGVSIFFIYNISDNERSEWERLITLAGGLYSLRLTIDGIQDLGVPKEQFNTVKAGNSGTVINKLNNYLNAIIGNAELAEINDNVSGEIKNHFKSIIKEAEHAADYLKNTLPKVLSQKETELKKDISMTNINDIINDILDKSYISDNTYMIGGRPHEINKDFGRIDGISFKSETIKNLFEETFNRFGSISEENDNMTVSTYADDKHVYVDISRHRKNFPSVERVSNFGEYQLSDDVLKYRPVDTFLNNVIDQNCFYSYDRHSARPSYLSFKFPLESVSDIEKTNEAIKILAIDDQTVILDLIRAMAQTSGYNVSTAQTGEKGLRMALSNNYDIVLTDLAMPGLSGLELAREIRKKKNAIPIVLLTGWGINLDKNQLDNSGITKVLYKPFRIEQLTDTIESLTNIRKSEY